MLQLRCVVVLSLFSPTPGRWQLSLFERVCAAMKTVGGLAEEIGLQIQPLQDVLGHAQDGIHWLDLFIAEEGESCHSEQSVEGIHLQR